MSFLHHPLKFFAKKTDMIFGRLVRAAVKRRAFAVRGPPRRVKLGRHTLVLVVEEEVSCGVVDCFDVAPVSSRVALAVEKFRPGRAGQEVVGGVADQGVKAVWRSAWGWVVTAGQGGCRVREVQGGRGGCLLHLG